jgi:hypothetical protein
MTGALANGIGASRPKKGSRGIKCPPAASRRPGRLKTRVAFVVKDSSGQALASVYFEDEPGRRSAAKLLSKDEARRIAANVAKLRA